MANDLNRSIKIYLDSSSAQESANKLKARIGELEQKLSQLQTTGQGNSIQAQKITKELDAQTKKYELYKQKVAETERVLKNLSGATYDQLLNAKKAVEKQLKNTTRDTELYNQRLEVYKALTKEITIAQQEMRVEVGAQGSMWSRAADGINKYAGIVGGIIATITGVTFALNKMRDERDKLEDTEADVKALTGLSDENISWLTNQAKKLSTKMTEEGVRIRSGAEDILQAYKVVGGAKADLLENKEALAEVTKQTLILATASKMDMKEAAEAAVLSMNQYGAAAEEASRYVNVLAAGSSAGAAEVTNIVNSVVKAGVSAASANVPIEQLVGSIEVLAERGIKDEIAGTGLKRFFLTLQTGADETNPKVVGLIQALETLKAKNLDAGAIKDMFGEQGFNVASVMIDSIEKVKELTTAVTDTTVAIDQARIVSETAAAKRAQASNELKLMGIELIENLNPAILAVMNSTVNWTRLFIDLLKWIVKNGDTITLLTTFIVSYTVAVNASVIADKLKVFWTNRIITATKNLYATMMKNPYALMGAVILTWILHMKKANQELTQMETIQRRLNNVENEATQSIAQQKIELEQYVRIAKDENRSKNERLAAIKKINDISPEYLGYLTLEEINTNKATNAIGKYIKSITNMAKAQAAKEQLIEIEKEKIRLDSDPEAFDDLLPWWEKLEIGFLGLVDSKNAERAMSGMISRGRKKRDKIKENLDAEAEALRGIIESNTKVVSDILNVDNDDDDSKNKNSKDKSTFKQRYDLRLKEMENEHSAKLALLKKYKLETEESDEVYNLKVIQADEKFYKDRLTVMNDFHSKAKKAKDKADINKDIITTQTSLLDLEVKKDNETLNSLQTIRDKKLQIESDSYIKEKTVYECALADRSITEEQYKALLLTLDATSKEKRLEILNDYLSDVTNSELKSGTLKAKSIEDGNKAVLKADLEAAQARAAQQKALQNLLKDFKEEFKLTTFEEDTKLQLEILKASYEARKNMAIKAGLEILELEKAFEAAKTKIILNAEKERDAVLEKYGLLNKEQRRNNEIKELNSAYHKGLLSEKEHQKALLNLKVKFYKEDFDYYRNLVSGAIQALQDSELANIDAKYDAEIQRAQGNSEEVARLENEKEQKKLDVQKKYADVNFAIKVSEIIANTAVSVMKAYSELGPIAGSIAAALMGVTGAAQIAIANAERKKIMNMSVAGTGNSSSNGGKRVVTGFSEGGYTGNGGVLEVAGNVHKMEYVVPAWEMQVPAAMNHVMALEAIRQQRTSANPLPSSTSGFADGGYTGNGSSNIVVDRELIEVLKQLNILLSYLKQNPLKAYVVLSELQSMIDTKDKSKKIGSK